MEYGLIYKGKQDLSGRILFVKNYVSSGLFDSYSLLLQYTSS